MKPIVLVSDKEKKDEIELTLEAQGYGFNLRGLHRYQKEHGLPKSNIITEIEANIIIPK